MSQSGKYEIIENSQKKWIFSCLESQAGLTCTVVVMEGFRKMLRFVGGGMWTSSEASTSEPRWLCGDLEVFTRKGPTITCDDTLVASIIAQNVDFHIRHIITVRRRYLESSAQSLSFHFGRRHSPTSASCGDKHPYIHRFSRLSIQSIRFR